MRWRILVISEDKRVSGARSGQEGNSASLQRDGLAGLLIFIIIIIMFINGDDESSLMIMMNMMNMMNIRCYAEPTTAKRKDSTPAT